MAVGRHEDVLGTTRLSFFASGDPYEPVWPHYGVGSPGADPGFAIASAADLLTALAEADEDAPVPRTRWRMVHVVMKKVAYPDGDEVTGAGVFLTRADADDYLAHIRPRIADCWIETLPLAMTPFLSRAGAWTSHHRRPRNASSVPWSSVQAPMGGSATCARSAPSPPPH
ncbi:hypothetical protein EDD29_7295 [Actinocorallia herbida]|uniref:Uncharacterized protein n=1 Tax=Actinocorallia herbida TaxID=58109 RepID=A0A3N1D7U5_9ACTN|nr:hypothetical protein [Actinocorallia herbida]ROO89594.1 hypothetical protein EDD29_7295 [Actinocorallia herbida]